MKLCYTYVRSTTGVSYAAPAYYADRLCERGRCYLRDFFNVDRRSQAFRDYETLKSATTSEVTQDKKDDLDKHPIEEHTGRRGRTRKVKTSDRARVEKDVQKKIGEKMDEKVLQLARKEWLKHVSANSNNATRENPWHPRLDNHMFWM